MIYISPTITLCEEEIQEEFMRASGPGGQKVNKASTAVKLRFDVAHSPSLPEEIRQRLLQLAGHQITEAGVLVIDARRYRSQERNRRDALDRLVRWIRRAAELPTSRRASQRTRASKERRLEAKRRRARTKQGRQSVMDI